MSELNRQWMTEEQIERAVRRSNHRGHLGMIFDRHGYEIATPPGYAKFAGPYAVGVIAPVLAMPAALIGMHTANAVLASLGLIGLGIGVVAAVFAMANSSYRNRMRRNVGGPVVAAIAVAAISIVVHVMAVDAGNFGLGALAGAGIGVAIALTLTALLNTDGR
jgi:hypothetical protein